MLAIDGLGLGSIVSAASSTASADRPTVLSVLGRTFELKVLLTSLSLVTIGVTYVLHGTAIITSGQYWRPLGWVALVVGLFSVIIGCGQLIAGATSLVFDWLFPFGTYASAGWLIWMGIELRRGWGRAAAPHADHKV